MEDFVGYLTQKYVLPLANDSTVETRKKDLGWEKDKIWMTDDFHETPDNFKDYL